MDDLHRRSALDLGQLLAADSVHQALVTTRYQEQVVGADRAALDRVDRLRREVEALAARLADQAARQERLKARLVAKRRQIESRLAAERAARARAAAAARAGRWWAVAFARRQLGKPYVWGASGPGSIHHVGMYIGGGAMIEAPYSGARVRVASIGRRDYIGAVRPTG